MYYYMHTDNVFNLWIILIFMNQRFCDILFYSPKNVKSPYLHQLIYQILASLLKEIQSLSQVKMENIPVEILELVFLTLSSLKDIQKCYSTSSKWRKIILNIFKNKNSMCIFRGKTFIETKPICIYFDQLKFFYLQVKFLSLEVAKELDGQLSLTKLRS